MTVIEAAGVPDSACFTGNALQQVDYQEVKDEKDLSEGVLTLLRESRQANEMLEGRDKKS